MVRWYLDEVRPERSGMSPVEVSYNAAKEKHNYGIRPCAIKAEESKEPCKPRLTPKEILEIHSSIFPPSLSGQGPISYQLRALALGSRPRVPIAGQRPASSV